jgi:hypothetical protein
MANTGKMIEFYDVKLRKKVELDKKKVKKTTFTTKNGQKRYGLRGQTEDGRNLTKFVSEAEWTKLDLPTE